MDEKKKVEIVICETGGSRSLPRYKVKKGEFGSFLTYCDPSNANTTGLDYPFEILFWGLPELLGANYKNGNVLEVSPNVLDEFHSKVVTGSLFSSNKELEAELMRRYGEEFPEEFRKHFG